MKHLVLVIGFRSKHSCESQLFTVIDDFAKALNNKLQVDVDRNTEDCWQN